MEKLVKNISRLVAYHNCVILPGVGAFLAHRVPACYNAAEKIFMPPHRTLGFNPQVVVDDALLQSEYMSNGKLSYEEAAVALSRDIETLRSELSAKGVVCFGELGTFTMDIEGKILIHDLFNTVGETAVVRQFLDEIAMRRGPIGEQEMLRLKSMAKSVFTIIIVIIIY